MDDQHAEHGALPEKKIWPQTWRALYSWAQVKDVPYRGFSRQRKPGIHARPLSDLCEIPLTSRSPQKAPPR